MPPLVGYRKGDVLTAQALNDIVDQLMKRFVASKGMRIEKHGHNVFFQSTGGGIGGGGGVAFTQVVSIQNDYLTCVLCDGTGANDGATVYVAKPFELQRTPFDTIAITYPNADVITYTYDATNPERKRSATDGTITETQVVTPMYWVGDVLLCASKNSGRTAADGSTISYVDLNTAGRAWAKET